jgi:hypothetical protein
MGSHMFLGVLIHASSSRRDATSGTSKGKRGAKLVYILTGLRVSALLAAQYAHPRRLTERRRYSGCKHSGRISSLLSPRSICPMSLGLNFKRGVCLCRMSLVQLTGGISPNCPTRLRGGKVPRLPSPRPLLSPVSLSRSHLLWQAR